MTLVSRRYMVLLEHFGRPPAPLAARGDWDLGSRRLSKEELLESGPRRALKPAPLLERDQNGGLYTPASDDLWTLLEARLQKLAEASLRVLHWPPPYRWICGHGTS